MYVVKLRMACHDDRWFERHIYLPISDLRVLALRVRNIAPTRGQKSLESIETFT